MSRSRVSVALGRIAWIACAALLAVNCAGGPVRSEDRLEVPYEPTHPLVVDLMLEAAHVTLGDTLYDLGCGDGRIAIAAVRRFGARAVCVDINPDRIDEAREKARHYGVSSRIEFIVGDIFTIDLRPATVVAIYLTTRLNRWLRPKLLKQLSPGTRIVSHAFGMGEWQADQEFVHERARRRRVYYYVVPADVRGRYAFVVQLGNRSIAGELRIDQGFQFFRGHATLGAESTTFSDGRLVGREARFSLRLPGRTVHFKGQANSELLGSCTVSARRRLPAESCSFRATRR